MIEKELKHIIGEGEGLTVEFKSSFNNEAIESLVAFANAKGGKVVLGVADSGMIIGLNINPETIQNWVNEIKTKTSPSIIPEVEIIEIQNNKIVIFLMQEYPIKPISVRGKYFKRVANSNDLLSTSEVVNMHLQSFNTSWDYHTNNQFVIDDISFDKVQLVIDRMNQSGIRITEDPLTFLIKNDLIRDELLTNAGFLLFTKNDTVLTTIKLSFIILAGFRKILRLTTYFQIIIYPHHGINLSLIFVKAWG
ncbi:MAG: putative DNA binding domain-containing protein [Bacteroidetes bacterium]|nr:putative DNA binding domain-containing protein [Bacteroidota bacterium]MBL7105950.1 putative DNA binding domain-containing protein [Bacteroidales bacterium]